MFLSGYVGSSNGQSETNVKGDKVAGSSEEPLFLPMLVLGPKPAVEEPVIIEEEFSCDVES